MVITTRTTSDSNVAQRHGGMRSAAALLRLFRWKLFLRTCCKKRKGKRKTKAALSKGGRPRLVAAAAADQLLLEFADPPVLERHLLPQAPDLLALGVVRSTQLQQQQQGRLRSHTTSG